MLKLWRWYQNCLAVHPLKTQVISSGVIWGLGDIAAQTVTHATAVKKKPLIKSVSFLHFPTCSLGVSSLHSCCFLEIPMIMLFDCERL